MNNRYSRLEQGRRADLQVDIGDISDLTLEAERLFMRAKQLENGVSRVRGRLRGHPAEDDMMSAGRTLNRAADMLSDVIDYLSDATRSVS